MKRIFTTVIAAVCVLVATFALTGCNNYKYDNAGSYTKGAGTIEAGKTVDKIEVDWIAGEIYFSYADVDEITFSESSSKSLSDKEEMRYWLDGTTLRIKFRKSGTMEDNPAAKTLIINLPQGKKINEIDVNTVSANVYANNIYASDVSVETVSGDVVFNEANMSHVDIETVSGNITTVYTGNKTIEYETVSGTTEVEFSGVTPTSVEVSSTSGNVELTLPDVGYSVEFDSVSGRFYSDYSGTEKVYSGGGVRIEVDTVSGNLTILE